MRAIEMLLFCGSRSSTTLLLNSVEMKPNANFFRFKFMENVERVRLVLYCIHTIYIVPFYVIIFSFLEMDFIFVSSVFFSVLVVLVPVNAYVVRQIICVFVGLSRHG